MYIHIHTHTHTHTYTHTHTHTHNDYPVAPERYKPEGSFCEKLRGTFYDKKDYIIDIRNLRFYIEKGLVLN
jgi:hypothetical protein